MPSWTSSGSSRESQSHPIRAVRTCDDGKVVRYRLSADGRGAYGSWPLRRWQPPSMRAYPRPNAYSDASRRSRVLPIPGSPRIKSTGGAPRRRWRSIAASSGMRPTTRREAISAELRGVRNNGGEGRRAMVAPREATGGRCGESSDGASIMTSRLESRARDSRAARSRAESRRAFMSSCKVSLRGAWFTPRSSALMALALNRARVANSSCVRPAARRKPLSVPLKVAGFSVAPVRIRPCAMLILRSPDADPRSSAIS